MSGIHSDATIAGGGYGGYGGGFGGIAPVGLFGLIGADGLGRRHDGGDRDCNGKMLEMFSDSVNERFTTLSANIDKGQLLGEIGEVEEAVRQNGMAMEHGFGNVKAGLKDVEFHAALNTKDIIASQMACCCQTKEAIKDEGCKTRELMLGLDIKRTDLALADSKSKILALEGKLDNEKQTHHLEHFIRALGNRLERTEEKIGSIVTGTGNSVTNSNNSGTQVGG